VSFGPGGVGIPDRVMQLAQSNRILFPAGARRRARARWIAGNRA
jgi:hypothetical protein